MMEVNGMKYYDIDHDEILTVEELEREYKQLAGEGETECRTFGEYLRACTDGNGSLIPFPDSLNMEV